MEQEPMVHPEVVDSMMDLMGVEDPEPAPKSLKEQLLDLSKVVEAQEQAAREASEGQQDVGESDEGRTVTEGRTLTEAGTQHLEELKNIAGWCEQISKHLVHVESRLMEHEYLAHEMVRQVQQALKRFVPFPRGDWGYLVRQCLDLSVRFLRSMAKYYLRAAGEQDVEDFLGRAMVVIRLFFEEGWRRHLCEVRAKGEKGATLRASCCNLALTMKRFEEDTLLEHASYAGVWWALSEDHVVRIGEKVADGVRTSIEDCPSWLGAKNSGAMKHDAFSLMTLRVNPGEIVMSKREVQA